MESRKKKKGVSMSTVYIEDDSDYRSEDDSTPASGKESTTEATKRKRDVSLT